ncbi:DNA methylase [Streptomyces wedmorensis]
MTRPRLLDACCCAGGASMGYHRAGFDVVGIDIAPRPNYPFPFIQGNAITYIRQHGHEYDAIHASWPCQHDAAITKGTNAHLRDTYADLYDEGRDAMLATGRPWVIETTRARPDVVLCAAQFGLATLRHRKFEVHGWTPMAMPHTPHKGRVRGHRHGKKYEGRYVACYGKGGGKATVPEMQQALGIDWTDVHEELTEAIPPAYTQFLGEQLLAQLAVAA